MARRAKNRNGHNKKRKIVKLEKKGLKEFSRTFGKSGQTFNIGLFDPESARKGYLLEYGDPSHAKLKKRPWLGPLKYSNNQAIQKIIPELAKFARKSFEGEDTRKRTAHDIKRIVQDYVNDQEFPGAGMKLSPYTINKKGHGKVGIDTGKMLSKIQVRLSGGKNKSRKK